jgi:hypothetical protein
MFDLNLIKFKIPPPPPPSIFSLHRDYANRKIVIHVFALENKIECQRFACHDKPQRTVPRDCYQSVRYILIVFSYEFGLFCNLEIKTSL